MNKHTIFISDLHLNPAKPWITELFLSFLDNKITDADALYILGDFFHFWAGDDDSSELTQQIKAALKKASRKLPIYLMPGNRDFTLGQTFAKESGCTLLCDPYTTKLYSRPTVLTHGDILCTKDKAHMVFRKIIQFPGSVKLFLKLPFWLRFKIASIIKKLTGKAKSRKKTEIMCAQDDTVQDFLKKYSCDQIIHGHTHIIETKDYDFNGKPARRISLGEWTTEGNFLVYNDDGSFKVEIF